MRLFFLSSLLFFCCTGSIHTMSFAKAELAWGDRESNINPDSFQVIIVASDTFLCPTEAVTLTAEGPVADSYQWNTGDTTSSIMVMPDASTIYRVTATQVGENLISNGDFEMGAIGFSSDYEQGTGGTFGILSDEATFDVSTSPILSHINFADCEDHTTGMGNMLVVNGSTSPNQNVWCQVVVVEANTDYQFSSWLTSAISENPAVLQFSINGVLLGETFSASPETCVWQEFFEIWNSAASTTAEICIVNQNTSGSGNDFALDDIALRPICISEDDININVSNLAAATTFASPSCGNEAITIDLSISGGTPPYTVVWSTGETTQTIEVPQADSYSVTISDATDCEIILPVIVIAESMTTLSVDQVQSTSCGLANGSLVLSASDGIAPYQYSVDGGATFFDVGTIGDLPAGEYDIIVRDANECRDVASVSILESVPLAVEITASPDTFLCTEVVRLAVGDYTEYLWSDGSTMPTIEVNETGVYRVTVTDEDNCEATASISIAECGDYAIPNVFTPNGDGENDTFGVFLSGAVTVQSIRVYNRWGKLVHDSTQAWDGYYEGEPHPSDVLIYYVVVSTPMGMEEVTGEVTLLR